MASGETKRTNSVNSTNKEIAANTNQANKDIAHMNNEFNLSMLDKQIAYNKEAYQTQKNDALAFWQMNNEYNDPSKQRARLEAAGLNPYMMMSGGSAGSSSSSSPSVPSMGSINPPTATPYVAQGWTAQKPDVAGSLNAAASVMSGVTGAMETALKGVRQQAEISNMSLQGQGIALDNAYKARSMGARVGSALAGFQGEKLRNEYQQIVNGFTPALMNSQLSAQGLQNQGYAITNAINDMNLQFLPLQQRMQAGSMAADIMTKLQQGRLTEKQIDTEIMKAKNQIEQIRGMKWTNDQKDRLERYFDDIIKNQSAPSVTNPISVGNYLGDKLKQSFERNKHLIWWYK